MKRREFIAGLTSAMASSTIWPSAGAQQAERTRRVGVLVLGSTAFSALRDGLKSLGWTEDRNLQLDVRISSEAKAIDAYADEMVRLAPEVILTSGYLATRAVQQRTRSIPIVFAGVGDPIENGVVNNLARPEGNTTGVTNLYSSIGGKWVSLLKDTVPSIARVGIVINPSTIMDPLGCTAAAVTCRRSKRRQPLCTCRRSRFLIMPLPNWSMALMRLRQSPTEA
jgi:putative ABC transport system substrate-binding protein